MQNNTISELSTKFHNIHWPIKYQNPSEEHLSSLIKHNFTYHDRSSFPQNNHDHLHRLQFAEI